MIDSIDEIFCAWQNDHSDSLETRLAWNDIKYVGLETAFSNEVATHYLGTLEFTSFHDGFVIGLRLAAECLTERKG